MEKSREGQKAVSPAWPEKLARRIADGDERAVSKMMEFLRSNDRAKSLPVLLALRWMWASDGQSLKVGEFAMEALKAPGIAGNLDPSIEGGLIVIVALHLPSHLSGAIRSVLPEKAAQMVFGALLDFRSMLVPSLHPASSPVAERRDLPVDPFELPKK